MEIEQRTWIVITDWIWNTWLHYNPVSMNFFFLLYNAISHYVGLLFLLLYSIPVPIFCACSEILEMDILTKTLCIWCAKIYNTIIVLTLKISFNAVIIGAALVTYLFVCLFIHLRDCFANYHIRPFHFCCNRFFYAHHISICYFS